MADQPDYFRDIIGELFVKHFLEEDGLTNSSEFWQRKGREATGLIELVNDRYVIVDEHFQLGSHKIRTFSNFIKHLPIALQLNHILKKYSSCINFDKYPWSKNDKILLDEISPWIQNKPISQFPFYKYFQPHQHRTAKLMCN